MAIIQKRSSLLTVLCRDIHESWSLLLTSAALALACTPKVSVPRRHNFLIAYLMIVALGLSSTGVAFGQDQYFMTSQHRQTFQSGPNAYAKPVTQVEVLSEATQNLQDSVNAKGRGKTTFNPDDPASTETLATLKQRAGLFEIKAQLDTLCAKGLQLAQQVLAAPTPFLLDQRATEWEREMYPLVYGSFTQAQRAEWFLAGKEILDYVNTQDERLSGLNDQERAEFINRLFALMMSVQVDALEKLSNDLGTRIKAITVPRRSD